MHVMDSIHVYTQRVLHWCTLISVSDINVDIEMDDITVSSSSAISLRCSQLVEITLFFCFWDV